MSLDSWDIEDEKRERSVIFLDHETFEDEFLEILEILEIVFIRIVDLLMQNCNLLFLFCVWMCL